MNRRLLALAIAGIATVFLLACGGNNGAAARHFGFLTAAAGIPGDLAALARPDDTRTRMRSGTPIIGPDLTHQGTANAVRRHDDDGTVRR